MAIWQEVGIAPADVLRAAGVTLGKAYPLPIVDHAKARARALAQFEALSRDGFRVLAIAWRARRNKTTV